MAKDLRNLFRQYVSYWTRSALRDFTEQAGIQDPTQFNHSYIPTSQESGITTYAPAPNSASVAGNAPPIPDQGPNLFDQLVQQGGSRRSDAAPAAYTPNYAQGPDGRLYDVNDPAQADQYYGLVQATSEAEQRRAYEDALRGVTEDTRSLDEQAGQIGKGYEEKLRDLLEGKQAGDVRRSNYFAQLSPNAFQSSEGSAAQYANDLYGRGQGEVTTAAEQTLGPDFLSTGQIGDTSQFGRQRAALRTEGDTVTKDFQQRIADIRNQIAGLKSAGKVENNLNLGQPANYNRQSYTPVQAQSVDVSQYQPFLTFQQQSAPDANLFRNFIQPQTGQAPVANYLGYDTPKKDKNAVNQYLYA